MVIINNRQLLMEFSNLTHNAHIQIFVLKILGFKTSESKTGSKLLIKEMEQC